MQIAGRLQFVVALMLLISALSCHAMMVTPQSPEDSTIRIQQAIIQRRTTELTPDNARRAIERDKAPKLNAMAVLKNLVVRPESGASAAIESLHVRPFSMGAASVAVGVPFALILMVLLVTRRAMALRERDRISQLSCIRPSLAKSPEEEEEEQRKTKPRPRTTLQEFLATRAERNTAQLLGDNSMENPIGEKELIPV